MLSAVRTTVYSVIAVGGRRSGASRCAATPRPRPLLEHFSLNQLCQLDATAYEPIHPEQKIGALDQAAPLVGWDLPEEFATLRRLIEARMAKRGKREFVQVLRLLEVFRPEDVLAGVREAIARGAIGFDAVKHLVLCRIERRPPRLR